MLKSLASHSEFIMRIFLAFVFLWFGVSEIVDSNNWVSYMPSFILSLGIGANFLVQIHGVILTAVSICLVFKLFIRFAGFLAIFIMIQLIIGLLIIGKFEINEIVVRDIGILGLAIGVWLNSLKTS